MSKSKKNSPNENLKNNYSLFLEAGLIVALGLLILLFEVPLNLKNNRNFSQPEQQIVKMQDIVQTKQNESPPPPPAPEVPQAVPNNAVISDAPINLNAELNINAPLNIPPPPPPASSDTKRDASQNKIFVVVQKMPNLIGGLRGLQEKIQYPKLAEEAGIEGTVYVQFVVNEQGRVTNAHVIRGIGGGCDKEALKVVEEARFTPGMQRGRPVKVRYSLPVVFRLQNE